MMSAERTAFRALVVDDSRSICELIRRTLEDQLAIPTVVVGTQAEAREVLQESAAEFFIALLDLNLPDAPNGEVVDMVQEFSVPSIVLIGDYSASRLQEFRQRDIIDYVIKRNLSEIEYLVETVERLDRNFGRTVLLVDDAVSSRQYMRQMLERQNLTVREANNGEEALNLLKTSEPPEMIVTDFNMPNMNGDEFIYHARQKFARNEVAIIGISASEERETSIRLLKAGANDFLSRPFSMEEFLCRVNRNLDSIAGFRKMRDLAERDFLTGLHNRLYLFGAGEALLQKCHARSASAAVAVLDIDFFKRVNDTHGHDVGDLALKHIARLLVDELSDVDVISRTGGEEFCVLHCDSDRAALAARMDLLRQCIEASPLIHDQLTLPLTVSVGVVASQDATLDAMITASDAALYRAKENGRNRVEVAD